MKKRLLALCLAAALLLGMMPALTLSTNAAETVTDVKTLDFASGKGTGYGFSNNIGYVLRAGYLQFNNKNATYWQGSATDIPDLSFDHTKEVLFEQTYNLGLDPATEGGITVASGSLAALTNTMAFTMLDADNGGSFLYYCITGTATGGYKVGFLKAEDNTTEDIPLTGAKQSTEFKLGIRWNINGTVTVFVNGAEIATTPSNVTWSVVSTDAAGTKNNPQTTLMNGNASTTCDFLNVTVNSDPTVYILDQAGKQTVITTTEYVQAEIVPVELDGYFTAEDLADDDALTEKSWNYAPFGQFGDYEAAVLVNKGKTYVALKGAAGDVAVTLGDKEATATIGNSGVAEIVFEGAVTAYSAELEMTVGEYPGTVTFASKAIDVTVEPAVNAYLDLKTNAAYYSASYTAHNSYLRFKTAAANSCDYAYITSTRDNNLVLDNEQVSVLNFAFSFGANPAVGSVTLDKETEKISATNVLLVTLKDNETGNFLYAYVTNSAAGTLQLGFLKPGGVSVYLPLGVAYNSTDSLTLYWCPDGSVAVFYGGVNKGKVSGVTWTADPEKVGTAYNPTADGTAAATNADFVRYESSYVGTLIYFLTKDYANAAFPAEQIARIKPYTAVYNPYVELTNDLAAELKDLIKDKINTDDLVSVPTVVTHPYLGNVKLTWSDTAALVEANGFVKVPETDTTTTLTATANGIEIKIDATVKAIAPVYGMFASNPAAVWDYAIFTQLDNRTESVAVLAESNNKVWVAIKGEDGPAKVTLGGVEKVVTIEDGMGMVAFDDVNLSNHSDSRTIKVTTATGTLETNVVFHAEQLVNTITTNIFDNLADAQYPIGDFYLDKAAGKYLCIKQDKKTDRTFGLWGKTGEHGDIVIDRSQNVKINWSMSFDANFFTGTKVSINLPAGKTSLVLVDANGNTAANCILMTVKDFDEGEFIYPYLTADENSNVLLGFVKNNYTENVFVDLGLKANEAVDLTNLYLVWNADDSVTVMLGDEELETVQDVTCAVDVNAQAGRAKNPNAVTAMGIATEHDFVRIHSDSTSGDALGYFHGLSFTYEDAKVVDIEQHKNDGLNIELGSDIGVNIHVAENPGATITVEALGDKKDYKTDTLFTVDGKYVLKVNLAAAQMTEAVSVTVVDAFGFTVFEGTMTVKDYANILKANPDKYGMDKEMLTLVDEMLDYGAAAQKYFGENTGDLAVEGEIIVSGNLANEKAADYKAKQSGSLEGIEILSAALVLDEKVTIRYYFMADSVDGFTFTYDEDKALTPAFSAQKTEKYQKNVWYVDVDVNPQDMGTEYTVSVNDGELSISYSCMTYMTKYAGVPELSELLNTMYDYYKAAEAVKPAN